MSERFFFALWPDAQFQEALESWACDWAAVAGGRVVTASSIHLTLAFLGEIPPGSDEIVRARSAAATCRFQPFVFGVTHAEYFRRKQLGWLGPGRAPPELVQLASDLRQALQEAAVAFDPQPFTPHITVLRRVQRFHEPPRRQPPRWMVNRFALMASVPEGGGRAYQEVAGWEAIPPGRPQK